MLFCISRTAYGPIFTVAEEAYGTSVITQEAYEQSRTRTIDDVNRLLAAKVRATSALVAVGYY